MFFYDFRYLFINLSESNSDPTQSTKLISGQIQSHSLDVMLWIQLQGEPDSNRPPSLEESFRQADTSLELNNPDSANSNDSHHKKV